MRSGWRGNSRRKERRSSGRALAPQRADLKACSYDNAMTTYEELRAKAQAAWQPFAEPRRPLIKVGVTTCSRVAGALETLEAIRAELAARGLEADLMVTGCWGLCYAGPVGGGRGPVGQPDRRQGAGADRRHARRRGGRPGDRPGRAGGRSAGRRAAAA